MVVVHIDNVGVVLFENFCYQDGVGEVSGHVLFGPGEGHVLEPGDHLLKLLFADGRGLHILFMLVTE